MTAEPVYSFAALHNRLTVRGMLVAQTGLRIGAGRETSVTSNDLPVLRDALGRPFLPGASLKGVLRGQAEALVRALDPRAALDLLEIESWQREVIAHLSDDEAGPVSDRELTERIWHHSTMIDQTFGAPWLAGRLFIKDALVDAAAWFGQYEVRNGVAIGRDTETAASGFLYDYEVVPAGSRFAFELVLENAADWQLGMVWLLLNPWRRGTVQVGGFRTRGLGYVRLEDPEDEQPAATYSRIDSVDAVITLLTGEAEPVTPAQMSTWTDAFRAKLATLGSKTGAPDAESNLS